MSLLKKILFKNKSTGGTPINATNLNLMQDNTETAVNQLETNIKTNTGNTIKVSIDNNYVMKIDLVNANGLTISTASIDFPIESMVVNASYLNGIITLTLQNGQTLQVNISDLVKGLVSQDTFDTAVKEINKKISDLISKHTNDITAINKEQEIQNKELEKIKSNLINLSAEGEEIQVNDSSDLEAKIEIYGNTKQKTTQGYNINRNWEDIKYSGSSNIDLIEKIKLFEGYNNVLHFKGNVGYLKINDDIPNFQSIIKPNSKITVELLCKPANNIIKVYYNKQTDYANISNLYKDLGNGWKILTHTFSLKDDVSPTLHISTVGEVYLAQMQIILGDTPFNIEPYTGGQASPNPEYPQEIESVKAYNLFDGIWEYGTIDYSTGNNIGTPDTIRTVQYIPIPYKRIYINQELDKNCKLRFYGKDKNYIGGDEENLLGKRTEKMFSFMPPKNAQYLRLAIDNENNPKYKLMCNIGEPKPYSPYGEISVKQTGKNLFNNNFKKYNKPYDYYIMPIKLAKGNYRINSKQIKNMKNVVVGIVPNGEKYIDFAKTIISTLDTQGNTYIRKVIVDDNWENPKLVIYCSGEEQFNEIFKNYEIQLEKGDLITKYEPYQENSYPIKLGENEMNKIGNAQDYFHRINGKWNLHKEIGIDRYSREQIKFPANVYNNIQYVALAKNPKCFSYRTNATEPIRCNFAKKGFATNWNDINNIGKIFTEPSGNDYWLGLPKGITLEEAKNKLEGIEILYIYKTPTEIEILDTTLIEQLDNLEKAQMFKGTNILTNNSIAEMKLNYIADTKAYIDNKLSQIAIANEKPKEQIMQNTPQTIPERLETTNKTENTNKETI